MIGQNAISFARICPMDDPKLIIRGHDSNTIFLLDVGDTLLHLPYSTFPKYKGNCMRPA